MFSGFRRTPGATPMQPRSSSESASGSTRALFACRGALSRGSLTRGRHPPVPGSLLCPSNAARTDFRAEGAPPAVDRRWQRRDHRARF